MLSLFHLYGLIVGLSLVAGLTLAEKKARQHTIWQPIFEKMIVIILVSGFIGARLWHVFTDWSLYTNNWFVMAAVWQGGLSIIGGVVGGTLGAWLSLNLLPKNQKRALVFKQITDIATFGLPLAQSLGRLANYFNQELYGLPTNLPWAISIDPAHRLAGYEMSRFFHPLFAYEMIVTGFFGVSIWFVDSRTKLLISPHSFWKVGRGHLFPLYIVYYSLFRIGLDFLRLNRELVGINQLVLFIIASIMSVYLLWSWRKFQHDSP